MSGYIGAIPTPQATQSRDVYTATSNQTTFTTQGYTPNFVSVYLNGVHLARADFTATNGSDVVLASGATADDVVEIVSFGTFQSADALPLTGGTLTGDLIVPDGDLILGSTAVTATAGEINLIDGGTARGTTAVADGDGFLTNDGGTMRMTKVDTLATYMGTKITGGSKVFIASTGVLSNAASVSFTQFDASKFDHYDFMFQYVVPATDAATMFGHASIDSGSNYDTTNGNYHRSGATDAIGYQLTEGTLGNASGEEYGLSGTFHLYGPHLQFFTYGIMGMAVHMNASSGVVSSTNAQQRVATAHLSANDVDAIQFKFDSGNITSGEIVMYGIANGT